MNRYWIEAGEMSEWTKSFLKYAMKFFPAKATELFKEYMSVPKEVVLNSKAAKLVQSSLAVHPYLTNSTSFSNSFYLLACYL